MSENEFSAGFLNETFPKFVVKDPGLRSFNPDLVRMFNPDVNWGREKWFGSLRVQNILGPGNRTEMIHVYARNQILIQSQINSNLHARYLSKSLEEEDGDVLGFAIPTNIGGPASEAFNVFAANQTALNKWADVLLNILKDSRTTIITWQFEYESENKTRPIFFYYGISTYNYYEYGKIINEHRTNLRRDRPFSQVLPKYEYLGNITLNLPDVLEHCKGICKTIKPSTINNSIRNFNKKTENPVPNLQSCMHLNLMDEEVKENDTKSAQLTSKFIRGMIQRPMVRLFTGENFTGDSVDYHFGRKNDDNGCYGINRYQTLKFWTFKSAATFDKCIRLFDDGYCSGSSLAIYGKSGNSYQRIDKFLEGVASVGPCFENEFINASFSSEIKGHVVKDAHSSSYIQDLVQFIVFTRSDTNMIETNKLGILYVLGPKNRTEHVYTRIQSILSVDVSQTFEVQDTQFNKLLDKRVGDVLSYIIPLGFGGPGNQSVNIFLTSRSKLEIWAQIFPNTYTDANDVVNFHVRLDFVYGNENCSRPDFVYYHFMVEDDPKIYYGVFIN